jgi:alpha-beta hydrolase superfamily lysophospholipase
MTDTLPPPSPGTAVPHRHRRHSAALVAVAVAVVVAVVVAVALHETSAPTATGFYDPPADLAGAAPGDVLRREAMTVSIPGAVAWRVLYRSTDPAGDPIAVSGVIITPAPDGQAAPASRRVVAWAHPTTGVARGCAPSLSNDPAAAMFGAAEAIANGWVWAATDYPGLGTPGPHPYLIGRSEAHAVLDAARAAAIVEPSASSTVAVWGHSQGGQAALWSGIVAAQYAPDLDLVGVAAAAPAIELAALVRDDVDTLGGRLLLSMGLVAWSEVFADAKLDVALTPAARPGARAIARRCIETNAQAVAVLPTVAVQRAVPFLAIDPVTTEPWASILADNSPTAPIGVPMLVVQGLDDPIVSPSSTRRALQRRCDAGETVQMVALATVGHVTAAEVSAPSAMDWVGDRFAGDPAPTNCDDLPSTDAG